MSKIAVVGSGVVGQATGKGFISKGHEVIFCDINPKIINQLKKEGHQCCTPDELAKFDLEIFVLTVTTPTINGKVELKYLKEASKNLGIGPIGNKNKYQLIVVRSTVSPGTTRNLVIPTIEKYSGKKAGYDFGVCMNPEYLREKSSQKDFNNPWIIVIGSLDDRSAETIEKIYLPFKSPIHHLTLEEAEMQKYVHNLYNACKISFFNEMRHICETIKLDSDKIFNITAKSAEASWNPKYGIRNLGPFSGSCLPKDTSAFLTWTKKILKKELHLLKSVILVNEILKSKLNKK